MHEYSIVQALLEQCEEHVLSNNATAVTKVVVKIGKMSGIEPHLLETAFDTFKEKTICDEAEFIMNIQPVTVECQECNLTTELEELHYRCPSCESLDIKVVDGEDMFLMQLELK